MRVLSIIKNEDPNGVTTFNYTLLAELWRRGYEPITHCTDADEARDYDVEVVLLNNREGARFAARHVDANRYLFFVHSLMNEESLPPYHHNLPLELFTFSERGHDFLRKLHYGYQATLVRNGVDMSHFMPVKQPLKHTLISLLDLRSGGHYVDVVRRAAMAARMWVYDLSFPVNDLRPIITDSSICIGYGRHALEAMAMGRRTIIYGINGGDGLVTEENMKELAKTNFSGWSLRTMKPPGQISEADFLQEILRAREQSDEEVLRIQRWVREEYCIKKQVAEMKI